MAASTTAAQWNQNFAPVPDSENRQSRGDFGAMLYLTKDPHGFWEQWERPHDPANPPQLVTIESGCRSDVVMGIVLFGGCKADSKGLCHSSVDYRVVRPDGSEYANLVGGELWRNRPAVSPRMLQASVANVAFTVEPDDPFGTYLIQATVFDSVANIVLNLQTPFTVKKSGCKSTK